MGSLLAKLLWDPAYYPTYETTNTGDSYGYSAESNTYSSYEPMYGDSASQQQGAAAHSGYPTQSTSSTFVPYSSSYTSSQSLSNAYGTSPSTKPSELSVYDPYKPTTAPTTTQSRSTSYSATTPSRSSFAQLPVNATSSSLSSGYETAVHSSQSSVYDPYKPSATNVPPSPLAKAPSNIVSNMSSPLSAPAMEPAKPSPPLRPAVSNAYDPPMPLTQRKKSRPVFAPAHSPMPPQHNPFAAPPNIYAVPQPPQNTSHAEPPPPPPPASLRSPPSYAYSPSAPPSEQYPRVASPMKAAPARATPPPPPARQYGHGSPQKGYAPLFQSSYSTDRMSPLQRSTIEEHSSQSSFGYAPDPQQNATTSWNGNAHDSGSVNGIYGNDVYHDGPESSNRNTSPPLASQEPDSSSPHRRAPSFEATRRVTPPTGLPRTSSPLQHLAYQQDDILGQETNFTNNDWHGDDAQTRYGAPYGHVPRPSFNERSKSPTGQSIRSGGSGKVL